MTATPGWLSVERDPEDGAIEIHGDAAGLRRLAERLTALAATDPYEPDRATFTGDALEPAETGVGNEPVAVLSVHRWPES